MKNRKGPWLAALLAAQLALSSTGCSLLFVNSPPSPRAGGTIRPRADCSTSQVAPVFDSIFAGLEGARVVYAASADDGVYQDPNQPLSREADVALGVGFMALFLGSAIYGYNATSSCKKLQRDNDLGTEQDLDLEPRGHTRQSPPASAALPAASAPPPSAPSEPAEAADGEAAPSNANAGGSNGSADGDAPASAASGSGN